MNVQEIAPAALAAFVTQLETQQVQIPERQYVAPGNLIPWDGEQLVVVLQQVGQGQPGQPNIQSYIPGVENLTAQFAVAIVRVIPALGEAAGMVPTDDEMTEAGISAMSDAQALIQAAIAIHASQMLTGLGKGFSIGPCATVGPEGGLAGHRLLFEVSL